MNKWTFYTPLEGRQDPTTTLGISWHPLLQLKKCTHRTQNFHSWVDITKKLLQGNIQKKCSLNTLWNRENCKQTTSMPRRKLEWDSILHESLSSFCTSCPQRHGQLLLWTVCSRLSHGEQPQKTKTVAPSGANLGRLAYCLLQKTRVSELWGSSAMTLTHCTCSVCVDPSASPLGNQGVNITRADGRLMLDQNLHGSKELK